MAKKNSISYKAKDGDVIHALSWESETNGQPKAIVQIAHGMAEHIQRYDLFARELVEHQIFVYGNDHRGHGMTGEEKSSFGYFADESGFEKVVEDMHTLTKIIKEKYPNVPLVLLGHSMGSLLARRYAQLHGDILTGLILSGTGGNPGILAKIGQIIAKGEIKKIGRKTPSHKMNKLTFGNYNKSFRPNRTDFDWLSRDEKEVDKYLEDPHCGRVFSAGFFKDLLDGVEAINKPSNIQQTPSDLPILLISGDQDPVGNKTKGVLKTYKDYKKAGIKNVKCKFYENARHEILNETNREEVYEYILSWIDEIIEG